MSNGCFDSVDDVAVVWSVTISDDGAKMSRAGQESVEVARACSSEVARVLQKKSGLKKESLIH